MLNHQNREVLGVSGNYGYFPESYGMTKRGRWLLQDGWADGACCMRLRSRLHEVEELAA
jgi:hypothetical protein